MFLYFREFLVHVIKLLNKYLVQNNYVWATLALVWCCALTSGQVWNKLRRPIEYKVVNNEPNYLNPHWKQQYKYESYAVATCYIGTSLSMILLIETHKVRIKWLRRLQYCVGLALAYYCFSLVLWAVRNKRQYPYRLIFE